MRLQVRQAFDRFVLPHHINCRPTRHQREECVLFHYKPSVGLENFVEVILR